MHAAQRRTSRLALLLMIATAAALLVPGAAAAAPQNPYLAPDPFSNIHNDTWMSDAYSIAGPTTGATFAYGPYAPSVCGSLTFDQLGRIVTVCPSSGLPPQARIIDPNTLRVLASYDLPDTPSAPGAQSYQDFTGGGYFFLGRHNRMWVTTKTRHLFVLAVQAAGFTKLADYDLTSALKSGQGLTSALPDFSGHIWFVSKRGGVVGVLNTRTRRIHITHADSEIENSFAVGRDGIYIVSEKSMYRYDLGRRGQPVRVWRVRYRNSGIHKPGQVDHGSGTTPTIMTGGYVSITDNADPMDVVVYRTAARLRHGQRRVVCTVPVFHRGSSATENSLIGSGRSMIVENNYGYQGFSGPNANALTAPGFARVDVNVNGRGCHRVWQTFNEHGSSVVPKLSTATGLIYTYTRDPGATAPWSWTAISLRTGQTVFKVPAGSGTLFNNNYAGIGIGPNGNAYLGTIGGLAELRRPVTPAPVGLPSPLG
jgi:hypothetical protein